MIKSESRKSKQNSPRTIRPKIQWNRSIHIAKQSNLSFLPTFETRLRFFDSHLFEHERVP